MWKCEVCRDGTLCHTCVKPLETGKYWPFVVKCPICRTDKEDTTKELKVRLNMLLTEWDDPYPDSDSD